MNRLTFDVPFCDIAQCDSVHGGSFCKDGKCSQRRVWERLKEYEDEGLEPEEVRELVKAAKDGPCGLCRYNPPSSFGGKPCSMCPAITSEKAETALKGGVEG